MNDRACIELLQWALPRAGFRWAGFRKVRRQVRRRIRVRVRALGLDDFDAYRAYLEAHPEEWAIFAELCRVTISRFLRDRGMWEVLMSQVLPALADQTHDEGATTLRCWSAGCASGEEPYTLALCWQLAEPSLRRDLELSILATDAEPAVLARARRARYPDGCLRELSPAQRAVAFERDPGIDPKEPNLLRPELRSAVRFERQDLREDSPPGPFQLVFCRHLAFTYFDEAGQRAALDRIALALAPGGALVVGKHEIPPPDERFAWSSEREHILRRV